MSEQKTMSQMQRESISKYQLDGFLDVSLGLAILFAVIFFSAGLIWLTAILPILFSLVWFTTKKSSALSGVDEETYFQKIPGRYSLVFIILTVVGVLAFIVGIALFWLFASGNAPAELRAWVENYFLYICAVGGAFLLAFIGLLPGFRRFYLYALFALVLGTGGPLLNIKPFIYISLFATVILLNGISSLVRYLITPRP